MTEPSELVERVARAIFAAKHPGINPDMILTSDIAAWQVFVIEADAAIATVMEATGWQDIATAPRDGSYVVLTGDSPLWKYPFTAHWATSADHPEGWWHFAEPDMNHLYSVSELVSHFIPLTPPPFEGTNP